MSNQAETSSGLRGRTAIVTGAGRGIGSAIARRLAAAGAQVAITSRTAEQLEQTQRWIERDHGRALSVVADVTDENAVERLVDETHAAFGPVDLLVNNAGIAPLAKIEQLEPGIFDTIIRTNIRSVYLCTRAVWGDLCARGGGAIVNISSVAAEDPFPGFAAYGAAKAFVNAYTKAMAVEGQPHGIRVYGIAPGAVDTDMLRSVFPDFPASDRLEPDQVAGLVELVLSPACRYISGQTIVIRKS